MKSHNLNDHYFTVILANVQAIMNLDADGILLWEATMRNTTTVDAVNGAPPLSGLFPILIQLLSENLDLLGSITSLLRSYYILDAPKVLQVG